MKKTNIIAVLIASLSVILLSNGIIASADNAATASGKKTFDELYKNKSGFTGIPGGMGMMGGMFGAGPDEKNVTVSVEKIDGGIRITKISTDSDTVTKLQKAADDFNIQKSITRTVTNITNGIEITTTSDNADAVKLIKEKFAKKDDKKAGAGNGQKKLNDKLTFSTEELTNGIKETITSTDPATVTKLQSGKGFAGDMGMGRPDFKGGRHGEKGKTGNGKSDSQASGAGN